MNPDYTADLTVDWPIRLHSLDKIDRSNIFLSQWYARTSDNRPVYIKAKYGVITVFVGDPGQTNEDDPLDMEALAVDLDDDKPHEVTWAEVVDHIQRAGDFLIIDTEETDQ